MGVEEALFSLCTRVGPSAHIWSAEPCPCGDHGQWRGPGAWPAHSV